MGMTVRGTPELIAALETKQAEIVAAAEAAVAAEARAVHQDERSFVPVLTGELQEGIEARVSGLTAEVGIWDTDLFWAIWIEWGRKNAAAQPFATPAAELARVRFPQRLEDELRKVL